MIVPSGGQFTVNCDGTTMLTEPMEPPPETFVIVNVWLLFVVPSSTTLGVIVALYTLGAAACAGPPIATIAVATSANGMRRRQSRLRRSGRRFTCIYKTPISIGPPLQVGTREA